MTKNKVIMVYPHQGFGGTLVRHIPLGLLYASIELVKHDFDVKLFDTRTIPGDWKPALTKLLTDDTLCVGISVMSGSPIKHALEIGRLIKHISPNVPVVWGGPHATFCPDQILNDDPNCDYVASGYASKTFHQLCEAIQTSQSPENIPGITWREGDEIRSTFVGDQTFEHVDYREIPYHLISDYSVYGQLAQDRRIFSMYSTLGCPYKCSFCSSPAQYSTIKGKKWVALDHVEVVDHVEYLVNKYGANYIYFIDDDSFPKLKHVENIIDEINRRGLDIKLGFRGARINEIKRMSDAFLDKLAKSGTDIIHIGAESGSDRILKLIRKDCTRSDIIECNKKLARHPSITTMYNFIMGVPTETLTDLKETRDLIFQLISDHPGCIVNPPNKFRPLPGTELYKLAEKEWGYDIPNSLEAYAHIENEADFTGMNFYDRDFSKFMDLLFVSNYFIDNKVGKLLGRKTAFSFWARVANFLYAPIARFRLKYGITAFYIEHNIFMFASRLLTGNRGST